MNKQTLLTYWDELTSEERRLIHDLMRVYHAKRRDMPMALLPFIPVDDVLLILRQSPMSPWSAALYQADVESDFWSDRDMNMTYSQRYMNSRRVDAKMYKAIIVKLTVIPSKLADELKQWQECNAEGRE